MNIPRRRRRRLAGTSALALLITTAACSATDDEASVVVPSPDAKAAGLCRDLHARLPKKIDGLERTDPGPKSELTAGWGDPAIILRCGVERPPEMIDPAYAPKNGVKVNGVAWLLQKRDDGSYTFTTGARLAYVEVTLPEERTGDGLGPLTDFAAPIKETIPKGVA
ncbi:DUF3515 domain-containing protein [Streptomyces sp. WAC 01529]|uniref:DUF3515 domain-containing protein n=1 Tax=Streptomyces sp. WAC 01529 TaxID=2203205 RepID=UPI000F6DAEA1|nr:DUF3515 domain-containing protein [Streptomyces sp. WAC 01529]AZM55761.1 DUF3515 domain-containing protein [Streptomyces sp. WAC 01529]